jgi:hypothetical protein
MGNESSKIVKHVLDEKKIESHEILDVDRFATED